MPSTPLPLLFAGEPAQEGHGLHAVVSSESDVGSADHREVWRRSGAEALLAVPLVRLIGEPDDRRIVVGTTRVAVPADGGTSVTFLVQSVWRESTGWQQDGETGLDEALVGSLAEPAHVIDGEPRMTTVIAAKALAEASRNEVTALRGLRYGLERAVADLLAQRKPTELRSLLAQIIELSLALSRARDHAREAVRDGLWITLWDNDTYRANRGEPVASTKPWTETHRAALRHCEAMDVELAEEVARLQSLLSSMSTFAVAQDGEAQQRFNMVAAAAAAGLGLPALILSLYGADTFLPFSFDRAWRALLPITLTALVAVALVLRRMPGRTSVRHYVVAVGLVAALVCVLLVAGLLAPAG
jgi:hypothetical protein